MGLFGRPNIEVLEAKRDVRGLVKALAHNDDSIRMWAADALRRIRDPRAVAPLTRLLRDPDSMVRDSALRALAAIRDPRAVQALLECLPDRGADSIASGAASALADIGDPRAVEPLLSDPRFHMSAARLLVKLRDRRANDVVIQHNTIGVMDAETEEIYLREMAEPRVVPALINGLLDPDGKGVRRNAGALGQLRDPSALLPLAAAAASLGWNDRGDSPTEWKRLREIEYEVLRAIHSILSGLEESGVVTPLAELVASQYRWLGDVAAFTLHRMAPTEADKLVERLRPREAREQILERGARAAHYLSRISEPPPGTHIPEYQTELERYRERRWEARERLAPVIQMPGSSVDQSRMEPT